MSAVGSFGNHWKAVPYSAAALVSGDAFLILFHLMRKSRGFMSNEPIKISRVSLSFLIGKSRNYTKNAINELKGLNLIFEYDCGEKKPSSFMINWDEIVKIHSISSKISDEGAVVLREKCNGDIKKPLSSLSKSELSKFIEAYPANYSWWSSDDHANVIGGHDVTTPGHDVTTQNASKTLTWSCGDHYDVSFDEAWSCCDHYMSILGHEMTMIYEKWSKTEDGVKEFNKLIEKLKTKHGHGVTMAWSCGDHDGHLSWSWRDHSIREYIREKRDQCSEAAIEDEENENPLQTEISSAKASEKRVFLEFRNLELPKMTYTEFQSIINDPKFNNTETDRLIQYVWKEIEPEENDEDELEERSKDDIIPVSLFNKILFEAWSELKDELPDFSLTEEDAKNIFGFEVVDMGEEFGYRIDSSFIRNIHQLSEYEEMRREKADNLQFSRMENRMAREFFVESLIEIADKDINQLTDMEYAVLRLDDFVSEREKNKMPRFDEITAIQMGDLIEDTANEAKVSKIALKRLCRAFKKKPNSLVARIRISALDFEAVFAYNREVGQDSVVEELLNKKLADYRSSTASEDENN